MDINNQQKLNKMEVADLEFLSETAMSFVKMDLSENIYEFIGRKLRKITGNAIVAVNSFDHNAGIMKLEAAFGAEEYREQISKIIGTNVIGSTYPVSEGILLRIREGKFEKLPGGFYEAALGKFSKETSSLMESLLKIKTVYGIGFIHKDKILGTTVVLVTDTNVKFNVLLIEAFVRQASIALQKQRAENELRESETRFRRIAESIPDVIWTSDENGNTSYISPIVEGIYGYTPEEICGGGHELWFGRIHKDDIEKVKSAYNAFLTGGKKFDLEYRIQKKDGQWIWLHDRSFNITRKDGRIYGEGFFSDITERKLAEEALRKSEERYRELWKNAPVGYHISNSDGIITDVNNAELRMLGYTAEEIIGRSMFDFIVPEERANARERLRKRIAGGKVPAQIERALLRKDGTRAYTYVEDVSEYDSEGRIISIRAVTIDISERKETEQELAKIQRLEELGVFAGGIAHDFNNMLTTILGNINILTMGKISKEEKELLKDADAAGRRAKELTRQLLVFSKGGEPLKKPVKMSRLVKDSIGFALRGSNVKPGFFIQKDLRFAEIDQGQIEQVLNNIVLNAVQAMPGGGRIKVKAGNARIEEGENTVLPAGKYIKITVEDKGPGIQKEHIDRIFDPFFTTKKGGSGLGLSVAYSIIKRHGGNITVESEQGKGSVFTIFIPDSEILPEEKKAKTILHKGRGNILLMDDEEKVRDTVSRMLEYLGYRVRPAKNGEEAIELYKKALRSGVPFNAVLLDMVVPGGMGGKDTVAELLKIDAGVKAVVITGYSSDPVISNFREYGFLASIPKPFSIEDLGRTLYEVMAGKSASKPD